MESMEKFIAHLGLIPPGSHVLCAVSGGADSVCLLHALYHLRAELDFTLSAAHFDHQLRGEESRRDADFVAQFVALCCGPQRLPDGSQLPAVPLFSGSGDVSAQAAQMGIGTEEAARQMRYAFLHRAAQQAGATLIATAHTADDNGETILFHLARGTGLRGLGGIPPARDGVIRPLLTTTRRQVENYLAYYGLPHVEDSSNQDDSYSRNRIRHQIMPVLEGLFPNFAARLADNAALLRADEDYLTSLARDQAGQAQQSGDCLSIPVQTLLDLPDPVAARTIRVLLGQLNGGDQDCGAVHLHALVDLCRSPRPSARLDLPWGLTARREYGLLVLARRSSPPPMEPIHLPLPGEIRVGDWQVVCGAERYIGQPQGPLEFYLSQEAVSSLTVRPRQTGDRLTLLGRPGKSIKKWFVDEKVPRHLRNQVPVFAQNGVVAAVAGLGPDAACLPQPGERSWHISLTRLRRPEE